jgi:hypothetical protein
VAERHVFQSRTIGFWGFELPSFSIGTARPLVSVVFVPGFALSILTADTVSNDGKRSALMSGVQLPGASSDTPVNCDQVTLHERAGIIDLTADLTGLQETAALLSCCDLVITSGASVAHLAATARTPDLDPAARFTRLPLVARPRR